MKKSTVLLALAVVLCPVILSAQNGNDLDVKTIASATEKRLEACPRREVVAAFERGKHKQVWQKAAWGPPTQVFVDMKSNDSVLYPYLLVAEFYLAIEYGPERTTKAEADGDTQLHRLPVQLAAAWGGRYRNTYLVNRDGLRLKSTFVLQTTLDGTSTWVERQVWPDACWDQIR